MIDRSGRPTSIVFGVTLAVAMFLLPRSASAQPTLSLDRTSVSVEGYSGVSLPSQALQVRNSGKRALKWSVVASTASWLSISPTSGVNNGTLALAFATSNMAAGLYQTSFRVDSNGGSATVTVQLNVLPQTSVALLAVSCPANITVASPDGSAVAVTYSATASGGVQPITVSGMPAPGSPFPLGTTPVQVTARSTDGQSATCGFSVTVTYSAPPPPPPASGFGPTSTITCPSGAIDIWPGVSIQTMVNTYPGATTFCIRAGIHYVRSSITPKTGNTFVGEFGAILDGTGWGATDSTEAAFRAHNQDIDYVTIKNLVIRNMPQRAINAFYYMADHWTIEFNEIAGNLTGLLFPPYSSVRNNYIHHNRSGGYLGTYSSYSTIESNEIAYNGREQKVGESINVTFRNNFVHHNAGDAIWYDSNNRGGLVEGNRVEDNTGSGIFFEISTDFVVRNNSVRRSGNAAMFISTSKNGQIYGNTLENNFRGILYFVNCSSVGGGSISFDLSNNAAYDNRVTVGTQFDALANGFSWTLCTSTQVAAYLNGSKALTFSRNSYDVPSPSSGRYWLWNGLKYWNEWQLLGQDAGGANQ